MQYDTFEKYNTLFFKEGSPTPKYFTDIHRTLYLTISQYK